MNWKAIYGRFEDSFDIEQKARFRSILDYCEEEITDDGRDQIIAQFMIAGIVMMVKDRSLIRIRENDIVQEMYGYYTQSLAPMHCGNGEISVDFKTKDVVEDLRRTEANEAAHLYTNFVNMIEGLR